MAVSALVYGLAQKNFANGSIDWGGHTIKVALLSSSYTPDQDAHEFFSSASAAQITGTGYTAGGKTLANKTSAYTGASNQQKLDADDVVWTGASFTCRYAVVYRDTGSAATSPLIVLYDFGGNQVPAGQDFTLAFSASGILTMTTA